MKMGLAYHYRRSIYSIIIGDGPRKLGNLVNMIWTETPN